MSRFFALACLAIAGCSFAFVHASTERACTDSRALPAADVALALASGAVGIRGVATRTGCDGDDCSASGVDRGLAQGEGVVMIVTSLVFTVAAMHGFSEVSECRRARTTRAGA